MKNPFKSKTLWLNLLAGVAAILLPAAQEFIQQHPAWVNGALAALNIALRFITNKPIQFGEQLPTVTPR